MTVFCFSGRNPVRYKAADVFSWDNVLLKKIMGIALPNGVENGIHQLVKVALSSMVALFGTYQITQWCGAEHLVAGGHHGPCHGTGVHHRYRPVHGRTEY